MICGIAYGQDPIAIAHRGGAGTAPENTLAAFNNAIALGVPYFECDVQLSGDDSLMIMHDATIDRTTDGTGTVSSQTYAELRAFDAGSWFGAEFAGEKIPTLREALLLAKNSANTGVVIEIKTSDASVPAKVVELVQNLAMESSVIVSSFSLAQITEVKSLDASIPVQLFASITTTLIDQVAAIGGEWVGSGGEITQAIVDYAHTKGLYFNVWTINSAVQMLPLIAIGVDAITTDYPEALAVALDDTEPSDVVLSSVSATGTDVSISWEAAEDPESGIAGYDVFRSEDPSATTLLTSVGDVTEYLDRTYTESQVYYYRIKAKNKAGLSSANYSNEISATTGGDLIPPVVMHVSAGGGNTIVLKFSERIQKTSAENTSNYSLNAGVTVTEVKLALDQESVILSTSPLSDQSYILTIENVKDQALVPNAMQAITVMFIHKGINDDVVAYYNLDTIAMEDSDHVILDATENMNHGQALNGIFQTEGILGNAIGFDGVDDYVQFESSPSFDIKTDAVTVALWTKLVHLPTELPDPYGPLFDSDGDQYVIYGDRGNSELRFKVATSSGAERPGIPNGDLVKGEWIHIAGVYDGTNAMIYLNGEMKDSHPLSGTVKSNQVATLGRNGDSYFEGSMDQVEVYRIALSQAEIMDLYESGKSVVMDCDSTDLIENVFICPGETYTFPDGTIGSETTSHVSELDALYSCAGTITTNLTLLSGPDVSVSALDNVLTATATGATYQWLDCDNEYAVIEGETMQSFTATETGNYAVEISQNACVDISECVFVSIIGMENSQSSGLRVYPNPNSGTFTVELPSQEFQEGEVAIYNPLGQLLFLEVSYPLNTAKRIELPSPDPGIYFLRLSTEKKSHVHRIVIR